MIDVYSAVAAAQNSIQFTLVSEPQREAAKLEVAAWVNEKCMEDRVAVIEALLAEAWEYVEMGRDFPLSGAGSLIQRLNDLRTRAYREVGVEPIEKPLENWQLRDLADDDGLIEVVVKIDFGEAMGKGMDSLNDIACEKIAADGSYMLQDIGYKVVGREGDTIFVKISADASEMLPVEDELTEECQNCGRRFTEDELTNPIPDLEQRVSPGEPMPSGECPAPDCRAVCHTVDKCIRKETGDAGDDPDAERCAKCGAYEKDRHNPGCSIFQE